MTEVQNAAYFLHRAYEMLAYAESAPDDHLRGVYTKFAADWEHLSTEAAALPEAHEILGTPHAA